MKYNFTAGNHFQFGSTPDGAFHFQYGSIEQKIDNWRLANQLAAQKIAENSTTQIVVLLSGGIDSEICLKHFLEIKAPVIAASLRFANDVNAYDLEHVYRIQKETGVHVEFFDLDPEKFWNSKEMLEITDPIQCVSPLLACHLWLAEQISGLPVIAQGEPHLVKSANDQWDLVESERLCSLYRHFMRISRPAIPGFFQYLPEQIFSFCFHNPLLKQLVSNQIPGKLGTRSSKNKMIYQFYPELAAREKKTGVEVIQNLHDFHRKQLANRYPDFDHHAYLSYENLRKVLQRENESFRISSKYSVL